MERPEIIFILIFSLLLGSGCSSKSENMTSQPDLARAAQMVVNLDMDGFPISYRDLLDLLNQYDFYDRLNVKTAKTSELSELVLEEDTLYLVENNSEEEPAPAQRKRDGSEFQDTNEAVDTHVYYFGDLMIVYTGSDEEILQALEDQLNK